MTWMEIRAPAKVNLFLELIERRSDGFHELETIMTRISLSDRLYLRRRSDDKIRLISVPKSRRPIAVPLDESNLVWRAVDELRQSTGCRLGIDIALEKHIPVQAGLGGGSSDAVAALVAANRLLDLHQSRTQLRAIADRIGSDTGFFLDGPTACCTGRGEQVSEIPASRNIWLTLAKPPAGLSTADVYRASRVPEVKRSGRELLPALARGNVRKVGRLMSNRLQDAAEKLTPWIGRLRQEFAEVSCVGHQMTGSGSGYFGLFAGRARACRAAQVLRARLPDVDFWCVRATGLNVVPS
ncbi:MAG: 4-(cytidine 5'-diphospho)-2-C-methyl-D-erythritol kinase [Pirellulaceae bacterium]